MGEQFRVGDLVRLKSSGPAMTVEGTDADAVHVAWFVGDELHRETMRNENVERVYQINL